MSFGQVIHLRDQAWASIKKHREAIDRIIEEGPKLTEYDAKVVYLVFRLVRAELNFLEQDAQRGDPNGS